jgi:hypothetical protein
MPNPDQYQTIMARLKTLASPFNVAGMVRQIQQLDYPAARWIAVDAIRKSSGASVQSRLKDRPAGVN